MDSRGPAEPPTSPTIVPSRTTSEGLASTDLPPHQSYARNIYSFASRASLDSLYTGEHYRALSQFLSPWTLHPLPQNDSTANSNDVGFVFVAVHEFYQRNSSRRRRVHEWASYDTISDKWKEVEGNRVVFLRGYPSQEWLCRLGVQLDINFEFFYQHFSNSSQLGVAENYCLQPLSLISTGTLQMTLTSIGSWDNHGSGTDTIRARLRFDQEMDAYRKDLNTNQATKVGDSIVRSFHLHDLKHFSVEQMLTIRCLQSDNYWTLLIWTDCGASLSQSHRGPWLDIQRQHSSATRFLPVPLHHSRIDVKKLSFSSAKRQGVGSENQQVEAQRLNQTVSFLYRDLGHSIDQDLAAVDPFYALDEIFRLQAASEHQFLNLMEEKAQDQDQSDGSHQRSISEIQTIKKLVDRHRRHLHDMLKFITARGGSTWPRPLELKPDQLRKTDEAAKHLELTFQNLVDHAEAVSGICEDEMTMLSNEAVVHEAQKSIEQADELKKITFIAFIFVPLTFATSIFSMNFQEIDGDGHSIWTFFTVAVPILLCSLLAWWLDAPRRKRIRKFLRVRPRKRSALESSSLPGGVADNVGSTP